MPSSSSSTRARHLVPVEFVACVEPGHALDEEHHRQLLINCFAQGAALMSGKPSDDPHRAYPGDRPSTTILLDRLDPATLGALIAFYEHRTFANAVLLGINPFDQFGVELGKAMAKAIDEGDELEFDPSTRALIERALGGIGEPSLPREGRGPAAQASDWAPAFAGEQERRRTAMRILIYLFDGITALDAVGPYELLSRLPEVEIGFVARRSGPVRTGDDFLSLHADSGIDEEHSADMLIVPGGQRDAVRASWATRRCGPGSPRSTPDTKRTCSVCTGSLILGAAGLLEGRRASTHWGARDYLAPFGATWSGERITEDGKYMTSAGVSAGIDLGLVLCAEIAGRDMAEAVQLSMEYDPAPPFGDAGSFAAATAERIAAVAKLRVSQEPFAPSPEPP